MALRIRDWRTHRGWTLKELSARCGIAFQLLSDYEIGRIDPPSSKLAPIAQALGVQVGDLFHHLPCHEPHGPVATPRPPRRRGRPGPLQPGPSRPEAEG